jgi:hypothetical protein
LVRESVRGDSQVGDSEAIILRVFVEDITGECRYVGNWKHFAEKALAALIHF